MRSMSLVLLILAMMVPKAMANTPRTLDGAQITNGAALVVLPTTSDTLVGRATTDTLTNKSISGSTNTFSNIPTSAISTSAALGVPAGGTGAQTLSSNGILQGNGTSAISAITCGSTGGVLTWGGSSWSCVVPVATAPSINGGSATPLVPTASGGVVLSSISYSNMAWLAPASAVTVTKTPSITACTADGQKLNLIGTSATNTLTLQDQANLTGSGLSLNGNWVGGKDSTLNLHCDITQGLWVEDSRR